MKKLTQNVNKDKILNDLPKVVPDFSRWASRWTNYISCNIGHIVPIYVAEVLPNETKKVTMAMCSHTVTPIAPIFNSMYTELRSFVVPIRLCADLLNGYKTRKSPWVTVFGEDCLSTNAQIIVPLANQKLPSFSSVHPFISHVYNYFSAQGYDENNVFDALDFSIELSGTASDDKAELAKFNFLTLAAYELICQRHYRNENYEAATASPLYRLLFDAYSSNSAASDLSATFTYEIAPREKDYFTGMKPFTLKGDPVRVTVAQKQVPVQSFPVDNSGEITSNSATVERVRIMKTTTDPASQIVLQGKTGSKTITLSNGQTVSVSTAGTNYSGQNFEENLFVDLRSVQGISIEELRLLIKTQELLEKDAMYGSLYAESLNAHFGCCPIDETLQDPQELYKTTITSNMQAIFQTSSTSGESSILGTIGANSTTQTDSFVIVPETKFKEHCILMVCAVHKLQNVYDAKYFKPKFNFKNARFDFYTPELDSLGYQPVSKNEMRKGSSATVGFNEAFAEYRYNFNKIHGKLASQFPYWAPAISDEYASAAALYKEDPAILDKALSVTSSTAPQFYDAWGFYEENEKPMSLHSIPGMDGVI